MDPIQSTKALGGTSMIIRPKNRETTHQKKQQNHYPKKERLAEAPAKELTTQNVWLQQTTNGERILLALASWPLKSRDELSFLLKFLLYFRSWLL